MKHALFIYGTLRYNDVRAAVFGSLVRGPTDWLDGWSQASTQLADGAYPNVVPRGDCSVEGEVLLIDDDALRRADAYETKAYRRRQLRLRSGRTAWVYVAPDRSGPVGD